MSTHFLHNKTCYIIGMGITGKSALSFLTKHCQKLFFWDDKTHYDDARFTPPDRVPWDAIDYCVLSPGIALKNLGPRHKAVTLAQKHNVPIISDIEIFLRISSAEHVGVTGTVGKSSCVYFLEQFAKNLGKKALACGNFGAPVLDTYGTISAPMIEMSSAQLDITYTPNLAIAIMTSLFEDHLDFHGGFENYIAAKQRIIKLLKPDGLFLCCVDYMEPQYIPAHSNTLTLSKYPEKAADIVCSKERIYNKKTGLDIRYNTPKDHVHAAFLPIFAGVAVAIHEYLGTTRDAIENTLQKTLSNYKTLEHRCEFVRTTGNITFINDSKATNTLAASYAISQFERVLWICGGRRKTPFCKSPDLEATLPNVHHAFLVGEHKNDFYTTLSQDVACSTHDSLIDAFNAACAIAQSCPDQHFTILLSPAATSFDQFDNFTQRGDVFKNAAKHYRSR